VLSPHAQSTIKSGPSLPSSRLFCRLGPAADARPGDGGGACGVTLGLALASLNCGGLVALPSSFVSEVDNIEGGASRSLPVRFAGGACTIGTSTARTVARIRPTLVMPTDVVAIADFTSDLLPPAVINVNVRCTAECVGASVELSGSTVSEAVASGTHALFRMQHIRPLPKVANRLVVSISGTAIRFWLNGIGFGPFHTAVAAPGYVGFNVANRDGSVPAEAALVRLQVFAPA